MRKIFFVLFALLFLQSFAIRAVSEDEYEAFLNNIGLNKIQKQKLELAIQNKSKNMSLIVLNSKKYRAKNPTISKKEYNAYFEKKVCEVQDKFKMELSLFMNDRQISKYLEFSSRVY